MRTYTIKQKQQAVALYRGGLSCRAVGEKMGISKWTIRSWVQNEGVGRSRSDAARLWRTRKNACERERAIALYEAGASLSEVGLLMDRSVSAIHRWVQRAGVSRTVDEAIEQGRRTGHIARRSRELSASIWRLRAEGHSYRQIAERLGTTQKTVWKYLSAPRRGSAAA